MLYNELLEEDGKCVKCGSKDNLQPHHITPCHVYDELFFKKENICLLCEHCHNSYHENYFPINETTFNDFLKNCKISKKRSKSKRKKFSRKEYQPHPLYTKIKINDFRKAKPKPKHKNKKSKRRRKRKQKRTRVNPIFLTEHLGTDNWEYMQKIELENEVLGDYT